MSSHGDLSAEPGQLPQGWQEISAAVRRLQEAIRSSIATPEWQAFLANVSAAARAYNQFREQIADSLRPLQAFFAELARQEHLAHLVESSGWLPHYTTPFSLLTENMDVTEINNAIARHYQSNLAEVEMQFLEKVQAYDLDQQVVETFSEALACHRFGLHRACVRLLFPEIERVACMEFYGGVRESKASLPGFSQAVMQLPAGHILSFDFGAKLIAKLESHLYIQVKGAAAIAKAIADPVPNRHAAIHGLVDYSTAKNSMNTLIMADFIFHLLSALKSLRQEVDDVKGLESEVLQVKA